MKTSTFSINTQQPSPVHAHTRSQVRRVLGRQSWSVSKIKDQKVSRTTPHPRRSLSRPDIFGTFAYRSAHFVLPLEQIMTFRWRDYVKVEGSDWTDSFNLAPNENPIQRGDEEQIIPSSLVLCQVLGFLTFPSHFMPLCFSCAPYWDGGLCTCGDRIFQLPICLRIRTSIWRPLVTDNVHTAHTAELDSAAGSLYSWGLKLINPNRKIMLCN